MRILLLALLMTNVLPPFPLHYTRWTCSNKSACSETLLSTTPETFCSPLVLQALSKIVGPLLSQSMRARHSPSFTSF